MVMLLECVHCNVEGVISLKSGKLVRVLVLVLVLVLSLIHI